jgi:hypothetical protein
MTGEPSGPCSPVLCRRRRLCSASITRSAPGKGRAALPAARQAQFRRVPFPRGPRLNSHNGRPAGAWRWRRDSAPRSGASGPRAARLRVRRPCTGGCRPSPPPPAPFVAHDGGISHRVVLGAVGDEYGASHRDHFSNPVCPADCRRHRVGRRGLGGARGRLAVPLSLVHACEWQPRSPRRSRQRRASTTGRDASQASGARRQRQVPRTGAAEPAGSDHQQLGLPGMNILPGQNPLISNVRQSGSSPHGG